MRPRDVYDQALDLFGPPPGGKADSPGPPATTVAIGGRWVDFRQPAAPRLAAEIIVGLATKAERQEGLAMVPVNFRGMVRILVERAFYNARRLNDD